MNSFFENVGIIAIVLLLILVFKKMYDNEELKRAGYHEDEKVYQAADQFVQGLSPDHIKGILASCVDFDGQDAEAIILKASPHRTDKDGGYRAFIRSVNLVLGQEIYNEAQNRRLSQ